MPKTSKELLKDWLASRLFYYNNRSPLATATKKEIEKELNKMYDYVNREID